MPEPRTPSDHVRGTVLCGTHAQQVGREHRAPYGPCWPASWRDGYGDERFCDVAVSPDRVAAYLRRLGIEPGHIEGDIG